MTKQKKLEFAIIGAAMLGVLLIAVLPAQALNAKSAGAVQVVAPGTAGYFSFSGAKTTDIPNGVLVWSSEGGEFWLRRSVSIGAFESIPMKIPAGASLVIPIAPAYKNSGAWYQIIEAYAAADSIFCLPVNE